MIKSVLFVAVVVVCVISPQFHCLPTSDKQQPNTLTTTTPTQLTTKYGTGNVVFLKGAVKVVQLASGKPDGTTQNVIVVDAVEFPPVEMKQSSDLSLVMTCPSSPSSSTQAMLASLTLLNASPDAVLVVGVENGELLAALVCSFPGLTVDAIDSNPTLLTSISQFLSPFASQLRFLERESPTNVSRTNFYDLVFHNGDVCGGELVVAGVAHAVRVSEAGATVGGALVLRSDSPACEQAATKALFALHATDSSHDLPAFLFKNAYVFDRADNVNAKVLGFAVSYGPFRYYTLYNRATIISSRFKLGFELQSESILSRDFRVIDNPKLALLSSFDLNITMANMTNSCNKTQISVNQTTSTEASIGDATTPVQMLAQADSSISPSSSAPRADTSNLQTSVDNSNKANSNPTLDTTTATSTHNVDHALERFGYGLNEIAVW